MGDEKDKGLDMEKFGLRLAFGIFAVFLIFEHSFPGSNAYKTLFSLASILAVLLLIKGAYNLVFKGKEMTFWTGAAIAIVLILFFNGMSSLLAAINLVFIAIGEVFGVIFGVL
ncbi:MAG: hypothetical protein ACOCTT_03200 [archaeon]